MPPVGSGSRASGSGIMYGAASVVSSKADTDEAFCNAERNDFCRIDNSCLNHIQTNSPVTALNPIPFSLFFKRSIMTLPSTPAFLAIWYE